jgi:hypothetical protein
MIISSLNAHVLRHQFHFLVKAYLKLFQGSLVLALISGFVQNSLMTLYPLASLL